MGLALKPRTRKTLSRQRDLEFGEEGSGSELHYLKRNEQTFEQIPVASIEKDPPLVTKGGSKKQLAIVK